MATRPTQKFHVELNLRDLEKDEKARDNLVSAILKLGPDSPLFVDPVMQQAVLMLGKTFNAYKAAAQTTGATRKQLAIDTAAEIKAKNDNDKSILIVKSLAENSATSMADLMSMAFTGRCGRPPAPELLPPESIDIAMGKKGYGNVTVSAHYLGKTRRTFAAEISPNPIGVWSPLTGRGKSRKLHGQSGTSAWVRFALIRGQLQSEWSTPVLVTFP